LRVLVLIKAIWVFRVGGAFVHVWSIGWCLEVGGLEIGALEVYKCIFEIVSVDLIWLSALV
jgi:hypothetical protein